MIGSERLELPDDRGVSPVIGVILMVAITVILAAIVGAFVLGIADNQTEPPQAGVDITERPGDGFGGGSDVIISLSIKPSADFVEAQHPECENTDRPDNEPVMEEVGDMVRCEGLDEGERIQVIGELSGERQVLQTYVVSG